MATSTTVVALTPSELIDLVAQRDQAIVFDEPSHTYTVNGCGGYNSVTEMIHGQFRPFQKNIIAASMAKSRNLSRMSGYEEIAKVSSVAERKQMILTQWVQASDKGTALHAWAEKRLQRVPDSSVSVDDFMPVEYQYMGIYLNEIIASGMEPWGIEKRLWDSTVNLAGTVDFVGRTMDGKYHLKDWKRCKKITKLGRGYGLTRHTKHLKDCNLNHYYIQLNVYKWLLETNYGIKIATMEVVNCHPNNPGYMIHAVPCMQTVVKGMMQSRCKIAVPSVDRPVEVVKDVRPVSLKQKRDNEISRAGMWTSKVIPPNFHGLIEERAVERRMRNNPKLHEFQSEHDIQKYLRHRYRLDCEASVLSKTGAQSKRKFLQVHLVSMWRLLSGLDENNDDVRQYLRANDIQGDDRFNPCIRILYLDTRREAILDAKMFEIDDIGEPLTMNAEEASYLQTLYD
jgi:hypothetical protein